MFAVMKALGVEMGTVDNSDFNSQHPSIQDPALYTH